MYSQLKSENIDDENYEREVGDDGLWRWWGIVAEHHTKVTAPAAARGHSNSPTVGPACVESWIADAPAVVPARTSSKISWLPIKHRSPGPQQVMQYKYCKLQATRTILSIWDDDHY